MRFWYVLSNLPSCGVEWMFPIFPFFGWVGHANAGFGVVGWWSNLLILNVGWFVDWLIQDYLCNAIFLHSFVFCIRTFQIRDYISDRYVYVNFFGDNDPNKDTCNQNSCSKALRSVFLFCLFGAPFTLCWFGIGWLDPGLHLLLEKRTECRKNFPKKLRFRWQNLNSAGSTQFSYTFVPNLSSKCCINPRHAWSHGSSSYTEIHTPCMLPLLLNINLLLPDYIYHWIFECEASSSSKIQRYIA